MAWLCRCGRAGRCALCISKSPAVSSLGQGVRRASRAWSRRPASGQRRSRAQFASSWRMQRDPPGRMRSHASPFWLRIGIALRAPRSRRPTLHASRSGASRLGGDFSVGKMPSHLHVIAFIRANFHGPMILFQCCTAKGSSVCAANGLQSVVVAFDSCINCKRLRAPPR